MTSHIRLPDIPAGIIEKYRPECKSERLFNMPVHCVVTWHMRKLEKLCGIDRLHYHMARHTFATEICLNNGVPMETLSRMMGHSTMRSTQIYGEITGQKVKKDMKKLRERTKGKYRMNMAPGGAPPDKTGDTADTGKDSPCSSRRSKVGPLKRFPEKSSSLCSGIFPENLHRPNTAFYSLYLSGISGPRKPDE